MDDGAVGDVIADASGEGIALGVSAQAHEVLSGVEMLNAFDFLLDDGTSIEIFGDIVTGSTDKFNPTIVGLAVGVCTDEGGKEGVMNVDNFAAELSAEPIRKDLHEASEDGELDVFFDEEITYFLKAAGFFFAVHFNVVEGDTFFFCDGTASFSISNDGGDLNGYFAEPCSP